MDFAVAVAFSGALEHFVERCEDVGGAARRRGALHQGERLAPFLRFADAHVVFIGEGHDGHGRAGLSRLDELGSFFLRGAEASAVEHGARDIQHDDQLALRRPARAGAVGEERTREADYQQCHAGDTQSGEQPFEPAVANEHLAALPAQESHGAERDPVDALAQQEMEQHRQQRQQAEPQECGVEPAHGVHSVLARL